MSRCIYSADKILRILLKNDPEYELLLVNERRGFAKFSKKWAVKRLIKRKIELVPFLKKWIYIVYFKYHKLNFSHCLSLARNFYFKRELCISFQSGFGDMLQAYPYFRIAKQKFPKKKIVAVIHSPEKCVHKEMSHCASALITNADGVKVDYLYEFLETNPFIDEIRYDDCWGDGYLYAFPAVLIHEFGNSFTHKSFAENLKFLYSDKDKKVADEYLLRTGLSKNNFIVIHFKTSISHLIYLVSKIAEDWSKKGISFQFLLLGVIPDGICQIITGYGHTYVDLSSSYDKGVTTRQLLYISSNGRLFLGGRGGFNAIFYLFGIPTVNILDEQGYQEFLAGLWPESLWRENYFQNIYLDSQDGSEIYEMLCEDGLIELLK